MNVRKTYIDAVNKDSGNADIFFPLLEKVAQRLGLKFEWMCDSIWCESRFRSKALNPDGGASGLIQFLPSTAKWLGTTIEKIRSLSNVQQLVYVEAYHRALIRQVGKPKDFIDTYCLVFQPAWVGKSDSASVNRVAFEGNAYKWNKSLDFNKDGFITKGEFRKWAYSQLPSPIMEELKKKPSLCPTCSQPLP